MKIHRVQSVGHGGRTVRRTGGWFSPLADLGNILGIFKKMAKVVWIW